ncbi:hypothetical protein GCK72_000474 [Caenorhabditis remanei]|uniref:BAAT/Acyl-CoA thioester hydrolase C-terminal domain-containing protein n=1 Tax=Caenorhabditis remanei TaxID=31234 RepID=A0A6A5HN84_CAERE|nr:hypothetical protein GCK72_000474 [Caenorhabditis remanei]KAF1768661.1 hypothetical protein GCK72_000474 [Caenorhabditis remanei]
MLHVDKVDSLLTEKLKITGTGLVPFRCYKFYLKLHYHQGHFHSYCVIRSDEFGKIDLSKDKPIRGTYHDVDPMGLFISLQASQELRFGGSLRNDSAKPSFYTLRLISDSEKVLDEINLKKHWFHPLVTKIEVSQDGLYGTIFKPPGDGPFPCIIDIPGANGKISNGVAAVYSLEGFLVYTLAFFDYKDLPKRCRDADVSIFSKHINFIQSLPYCSDKIGLYGMSLGGTIVNFLSTKHPELSAVCSMNGPESFYKPTALLKENGKLMECEYFDHKLSINFNGVIKQSPSFTAAFEKLKPETSIKWNHISKNISFRIISTLDDWILDGVVNGSNVRRQLINSGHHVEIDFVPGGHLIYVPYYPHSSHTYNKFDRLSLGFGGECTLHGKSQETVWENNFKFFKKVLGTPPSLPDYERDTVVVVPDSELKRDSKL